MNFIPQEGQLIDCPICTSKYCLKEAISDGVFSYLCVICGYMSSDHHVNGSDLLNEYTSNSPELIVDLGVFDESRGIVWFPSTLQLPDKGCVYPTPHEEDGWCWSFAPIVEITDEERENYPIIEKPGEYHTKRLAVDQCKTFKNSEFYVALQELGAVIDIDELDLSNNK